MEAGSKGGSHGAHPLYPDRDPSSVGHLRRHDLAAEAEHLTVSRLREAPDSLSTAAFAMTVLGSGRFKTIRTTEIFTAEDAVEAMRKAGGMTGQYRPPAQR